MSHPQLQLYFFPAVDLNKNLLMISLKPFCIMFLKSYQTVQWGVHVYAQPVSAPQWGDFTSSQMDSYIISICWEK